MTSAAPTKRYCLTGVPVHVVAARCGHDPATLLRSYAKRTRKADTIAASVIGSITKGFWQLKHIGPTWVQERKSCQSVLVGIIAKLLIPRRKGGRVV